MKCPRCATVVTPAETACAKCGFSATSLYRSLGNQWVRLDRITDVAHCLRLEETRYLEVILDDFERNFPQAFFAVYLGLLPNGLHATELGFWLLNQGAFNTHSVVRRNDFGIIMVVDPSTQTASLTFGYALEGLFEKAQSGILLSKMRQHLSRRRYSAAIEMTCLACADVMKKAASKRTWKAKDAQNGPPPPNLGLLPLRGGHRQQTRIPTDSPPPSA